MQLHKAICDPAGEPDHAAGDTQQVLLPGSFPNVLEDLDRLALHRKVHEEKIEHERGGKYTKREHKPDRVRAHSHAETFAELHQGVKRAHEQPRDQAQNDSFRGDFRCARLQHAGFGLVLELGG